MAPSTWIWTARVELKEQHAYRATTATAATSRVTMGCGKPINIHDRNVPVGHAVATPARCNKCKETVREDTPAYYTS